MINQTKMNKIGITNDLDALLQVLLNDIDRNQEDVPKITRDWRETIIRLRLQDFLYEMLREGGATGKDITSIGKQISDALDAAVFSFHQLDLGPQPVATLRKFIFNFLISIIWNPYSRLKTTTFTIRRDHE